MDLRRVGVALISLHVVGFVFDVIVLAVTGTAWAQALPIELEDYLGNSAFISRHRAFETAYDWSVSGGRRLMADASTGNYVSNYIQLVYATAAFGLFWNLVFALYRLASQHTNTIFRATAVNISKWARWPFFELLTAAIWWVLWLASAAGVSSTTEANVAAKGQVKGLAALQALMAFLWFSWFVWSAILALSALQYRHMLRAARQEGAASDVEATGQFGYSKGHQQPAHIVKMPGRNTANTPTHLAPAGSGESAADAAAAYPPQQVTNGRYADSTPFPGQDQGRVPAL